MELNQNLTQESAVNSNLEQSLNFQYNEQVILELSDIKYVCMQGSQARAEEFAKKLATQKLGLDTKTVVPINLLPNNFYSMYKIGNVLSISHGMGGPSILGILHMLTKMLYLANNNDVTYIRLGTSGGIGLEPGSIVVTNNVYMSNLELGYKMSPLGKDVIYSTQLNRGLNEQLVAIQPNSKDYQIYTGNTIAADDFYYGQGRFDGAIPPKYDHATRLEYFNKIKQLGILNFEMESGAFSSFCNRANIKAIMLAVTLIDRMHGDQVSASHATLEEYANRVQQVVLNYIK